MKLCHQPFHYLTHTRHVTSSSDHFPSTSTLTLSISISISVLTCEYICTIVVYYEYIIHILYFVRSPHFYLTDTYTHVLLHHLVSCVEQSCCLLNASNTRRGIIPSGKTINFDIREIDGHV